MNSSTLVFLAALACAGRNGDRQEASRTAAAAPEAKLLRASSQCGGGTAGATWIGSNDEYQRAVKELAGAIVGEAEPPPAIDFSTHGVLRVDMGPRPTAGYAVALAAPAFTRESASGVLRVSWTEPAPGAMTAQVQTSPCVLVAVPRAGLREVRVVDQGGTVRGRAEVR